MSLFSSIIPSAISFAGSLLGGRQTSKASEHAADVNAEVQRDINAQNIAMQRETNELNRALFEQSLRASSIPERVRQAKEAGLHPLSSLGVNLGANAPQLIAPQVSAGAPVQPIRGGGAMWEALGKAGQDITRALLASEDEKARQSHEAALEVARARAANDFAQASYWSSKANMIASDVSVTPIPSWQWPTVVRPLAPVGAGAALPSSMDAPSKWSRSPTPAGFMEHKPDELTSSHTRDRSQTAADYHPLWQTYRWNQRGMPLDLPRSNDPGETLSEMGPFDAGFWMTLQRNVSRYGWGWLWDAIRQKKSGGASGRF